MLKLSKLEVFSVVVEEGSFSAAAKRMHLSQPAVSRHIQELESALGIRLFRRQRRGVALTTGGEILRQYTEKILWLVGEAEGCTYRCNPIGGGGRSGWRRRRESVCI
jgi:DNA-binding transcriptional LysR family regulator